MTNRIVLVIAAHSDDEAIGCSGTIAKHIKAGDKVHFLFMTDGVGARERDKQNSKERYSAMENVAYLLKVESVECFNFPDNAMDSIPLISVVKKIENKIKDLQPEVIYTHHIGDLNIDHQLTHKAVMTACRPQPQFSVKEIYSFEVVSSTEWQTPGVLSFMPNVYEDISDYIGVKAEALRLYSNEMRQEPHARSIENILSKSKVRGSEVGLEYAEAFVLNRLIK